MQLEGVGHNAAGRTSPAQECEHSNPICVCSRTDPERAELLRGYLDVLATAGWSDVLLLPVDRDGKAPKIAELGIPLDSERARELLHTPEEAVDAVRKGQRGFALYAGREEHGTGDLVFTDHDDADVWPPSSTPDSVLVMTGSGEGYHKPYRNAGDVQNSKGKGEYLGAGEVRARNWYVVLPGSIHASGGIYHMTENRGIGVLRAKDLPRGLRPGTIVEAASEKNEPVELRSGEIDNLSEDFDAGSVTNEWGAELRDVRMASRKLDRLLSVFNPGNEYESTSEADQAAVSMLLIWRFDETDIVDILRACRSRKKMAREDYIWRTIHRTALTQRIPVDPELGPVLIESAKENRGIPKVGNATLFQVQNAFAYRKDATVAELADDDILDWGNAKRKSTMRRIRRALKVLKRAGYVSQEWRGEVIWQPDGLDELTLQEGSRW